MKICRCRYQHGHGHGHGRAWEKGRVFPSPPFAQTVAAGGLMSSMSSGEASMVTLHNHQSQSAMWRDESLRRNRAQWSVLNQLMLDLVCWSSVADASLCLLSIASRCDIDKIVELPPAACRSSASALSSHSGSVTPHAHAHAHWFSPGPCLHSADPIASIRHPHLGPAPELISSSPSRPHLVRGLVVSTLS